MICNSAVNNAKIKQYIMNHYDPSDYDNLPEDGTFSDVSDAIYQTFRNEMYPSNEVVPEGRMFQEWMQGLPAVIDAGYYYNRSAVEDLASVCESDEELDETDESVAEEALTWLIWAAICEKEEE